MIANTCSVNGFCKLLWTVYRLCILMFFTCTVTKSSFIGSISWATVLISSHPGWHWFNASCLLGCGSGSAYCRRRVQADTDPMSVECWASVASAGQYPFNPSQYLMLAVLHDALNHSRVNVGRRLRCSPKFSVAPNTPRSPHTGLMLVQRRGRWASISPAFGQRLVFDHLQ